MNGREDVEDRCNYHHTLISCSDSVDFCAREAHTQHAYAFIHFGLMVTNEQNRERDRVKEREVEKKRAKSMPP